jgi:hypothetical protein
MAKTSPDRPESLRERAQWYRAFAEVCGGDNGWALRLADHLDKLAAEAEARIAGGK